MKNLWAPRPAVSNVVKAEMTPEVAMADRVMGLANIEPAAGHGDEEKAEGGHAEPTAHGKTEGQKSFSGKVLGAPPPLPTVTIGGQAIITNVQRNAREVAESTPDGLKGNTMQELLERRFSVTPYAHSPHRGNPDAPIKVIEFVDLSCGQCMPELTKIDMALAAISNSVVVTHIHAPTTRFQDTNLPAFYAKIANKDGKFWVFRNNLIQDKPVDANAIFDELVKSGMSVPDARTAMLNEARRFYRELDADSLLARAFGIGKPPVLFVNGIRVGEAGIPLDKLEDVIKYVQERIKRGLPEPPK
jgi:protein-disulfide isomerase